jgi:hypothetical protein
LENAVISESRFWKEDIEKIAKRMRKYSIQSRWTERSHVNFEKDLFIAFYAVRKLIEAKKLTRTVLGLQLKASSFPSTGKGVTHLNSHKIDEHFDLEKKTSENLDLAFVCNQIIHSYIYMTSWTEQGLLEGIMVSSDYQRNKKLYYIELNILIDCLDKVSHDYAVELRANRNPKTGDFDIILYAADDESAPQNQILKAQKRASDSKDKE